MASSLSSGSRSLHALVTVTVTDVRCLTNDTELRILLAVFHKVIAGRANKSPKAHVMCN